MSIIWRSYQISVKNCRIMIRRCFFSQQLSLIAPSTVIAVPVQKQQFTRQSVCNIWRLANQDEQFYCICGEVVLKSQEVYCRNFWDNLKNCILYLRSEITIKFGCQEFAAPPDQELWQAMDKAFPVQGKMFRTYMRPSWEKEFLMRYKLNNCSKNTTIIQN